MQADGRGVVLPYEGQNRPQVGGLPVCAVADEQDSLLNRSVGRYQPRRYLPSKSLRIFRKDLANESVPSWAARGRIKLHRDLDRREEGGRVRRQKARPHVQETVLHVDHVGVRAVPQFRSVHRYVFHDLLGASAGPLLRNIERSQDGLHAPFDVALTGWLVDTPLEHVQLAARV